MRRAADDMRRNDGESAAQSGQRAAEQLRRVEGQMRGAGGADGRQRAAADLQSEAQQIAEEQRRIAAEAERMEKSGQGGDDDARRRLAADKDRLADRVDNLQREAARLGQQKGGDESSRAREAAGTLDKGKVGERMRDTAQQMRDGARPSAGAEQQLASTLDRVVDTLGGASSADTRKLAEQLDQSRQIRERLDGLEAQLKAAEGKNDGRTEGLRQEYERELGRARETLGRQPGGSDQRDGSRGSTPEGQEFSRSAPGTEAFKQDRSRWQSLRNDVDRALEEHDAAVSKRLAKTLGEDRLNGGGSDRVPEQYRRLVARYYESLAGKDGVASASRRTPDGVKK
jgi:hypothetical protein